MQFKLHTKVEGSSKHYQWPRKINVIKISDVKEFFDTNDINDVNKFFVKITNEADKGHTASLKEILSISCTEGSDHYFLRRGEWNRFNSAFMKYLSASLKSITFVKKDSLKEDEFKVWKILKKTSKLQRIFLKVNYNAGSITLMKKWHVLRGIYY